VALYFVIGASPSEHESMKTIFYIAALALSTVSIVSCTKETITHDGFTDYVIRRGEHSTDHSDFSNHKYSRQEFLVKFDSSAIYQTIDPANQYDINKLYGFADNNAHHQQFSARFGWRWSDGALRLFAYVYNTGERIEEEITTINIGETYRCRISIEGNRYVFSVNGIEKSVPRASASTQSDGYLLYPYFGGDEVAPHDIHIYIKEE
jgi:hypothetical protein